MPLTLNHNGLVVWHITESRQELEALTRAERNDKLSDHRAAEKLVATHLTQKFLNSTIAHHPDGAPYPTHSDKYISISHTTNYLALKISESPCAIDMENLDRNAKRIAKKFATTTEINTATKVLPQNPELLIWCAKETLYKFARRAGAEFLTDFCLLKAYQNEMECACFNKKIVLKYTIYNNILIVENK